LHRVIHSAVDITAAKGFTAYIRCLFDPPAALWQPSSWDLWRIQEPVDWRGRGFGVYVAKIPAAHQV
jgi:hypothetical protein